MEQNNERVKARLQKLLALARGGQGGEKDNAQRMLENMLRKYGMTMADLDDAEEKREKREFKYKGDAEKRILTQIVASVVLDWNGDAYSYPRLRGVILFELTRAEHIEVDLMYEAHRKALKKHLAKTAEQALSAYIQTNRIFAKRSEEPEEKGESNLSMKDLQAIMAMMATMEPTPVHRAIECK